MKKNSNYIIPIVTIIFFVLIMTTGGILKKPFGKNDNVEKYMHELKIDIEAKKWGEAKQHMQSLSNAWRKVEKRVQFSVERDDINDININLARLKGALTAKDVSSAIIELSEAKEHWGNLEG